MSFFNELKRRNVFRVGIAYAVVAWLVMQFADVVLNNITAPGWVFQAIMLLLAIGFPIVLVFAWAFEMTPEGLKKEKDIDRSQSIAPRTGRKLDRTIILVLVLALAYFAFDKFTSKAQPDGASKTAQIVADKETASEIGSPVTPVERNRDDKSVAVLPFAFRSTDPEDQFFAEGMHDDLLTQLAKIGSLKVISRTSVMEYKDTTKKIPQIAEELGVSTIVEGGVQRSGSRIRFNAQLIDAQTDEHLWAEIFDRELTAENLFVIQSDISRAIAQSLHATLTADETLALESIPTNNLAAYEAYISARARLESTSVADLEIAVKQFTAATQLDPDFAAAWAGLCEANLGFYSSNSDQSHFEAAEAACNKALELDGSRLDVYVALGALYRYLGQYSRAEVSLQQANFAKAEQALENALEINNRSLDAKVELGKVLAEQGRLEEAEAELVRVVEMEPTYWRGQTALFGFYYSDSDKDDNYELASRHAVLAASLRPELASSWNNVAVAKFMLLQYDEAAEAWQQSLAIEPTRSAYTNTGLALYSAGRFEESARMQEKAAEMAPKDHRVWGRLADALLRIEGEKERAIETYSLAADLAREKLDVNAKDWRTLGYLSVYLFFTGDSEAATAAYESALQLSGRRAEALMRAALVNLESGNTDETLTLLEEMVAKDPSYLQFVETEFSALADEQRFQAIIAKP